MTCGSNAFSDGSIECILFSVHMATHHAMYNHIKLTVDCTGTLYKTCSSNTNLHSLMLAVCTYQERIVIECKQECQTSELPNDATNMKILLCVVDTIKSEDKEQQDKAACLLHSIKYIQFLMFGLN